MAYYSSCGLTNEVYACAVTLTSPSLTFTVRRTNLRVLLAWQHIFKMCASNVNLTDSSTPMVWCAGK